MDGKCRIFPINEGCRTHLGLISESYWTYLGLISDVSPYHCPSTLGSYKAFVRLFYVPYYLLNSPTLIFGYGDINNDRDVYISIGEWEG